MSKSIAQSQIIFNMNDRLFLSTLQGVTEEQAKERIIGHVNPVIWIAAHTVSARYNALIFLNAPVKNPYNDLFENFRPYDSSLDYPLLAEVREEWKKVSGLLQDAIKNVSEEYLAADAPIKNPIGNFTNWGTVTFFTQHESYDIGQLGLLKKFLTKEAMSYN